jgi:hypothetical protein
LQQNRVKHMQRMRWRVRSVRTLTTERCLNLFINSPNLGGSGSHTLQMLNPWDYFLWSYPKTIVKNNQDRVEEIKQEISARVTSASDKILASVLCLLRKTL